jgi:hypothetical protein
LIEQARERGFHPRTLGADKSYDTRDCVAELRRRQVTPHVAQNSSGRRSAIDGRTTHHVGYAISQCIRKRVEIVCSQLTKTGVRTGVGGRNDVPNLHCVIGHDYSVNEQLYQLAALLQSGLVEPTRQQLDDLRRRTGHAFDRDKSLTLSDDFALTREDVFFA